MGATQGRILGVVRIRGVGLANVDRPGLPEARKKELWGRWQAGESISDIARTLQRSPDSIHGVLKAAGGIVPPATQDRVGTHSEWEEISRGLALGESMRAIAARLGRSASTVSREVDRNGGLGSYRAATADERA